MTTVTLDQSYFEALLRHANVHSGSAQSSSASVEHAIVPKSRLDELENGCREYLALRSTLLAGGVTAQNLELLVNTGLDALQIGDSDHKCDFDYTQRVEVSDGTCEPQPSLIVASPTSSHDIESTDAPLESQGYGGDGQTWEHATNGKTKLGEEYSLTDGTETQCRTWTRQSNEQGSHGGDLKRTLLFTRLPQGVTYSSFLGALKNAGGAIVDAWMKPADHCGSISFVEPSAAEAFYRHTRKNDMFIDGRRVRVDWRETGRQFQIAPNIQRQIQYNGATRVLCLRNAPAGLTSDILRDDLDHIANCYVEKIIFIKGRIVYVHLNSVCVALFARTCLRSRAFYRGCKIEFGKDDCADPLPNRHISLPDRCASVQSVKHTNVNRFEALRIDDDDSSSRSDDASYTESYATSSNWADSIYYTESSMNGVSI